MAYNEVQNGEFLLEFLGLIKTGARGGGGGGGGGGVDG